MRGAAALGRLPEGAIAARWHLSARGWCISTPRWTVGDQGVAPGVTDDFAQKPVRPRRQSEPPSIVLDYGRRSAGIWHFTSRTVDILRETLTPVVVCGAGDRVWYYSTPVYQATPEAQTYSSAGGPPVADYFGHPVSCAISACRDAPTHVRVPAQPPYQVRVHYPVEDGEIAAPFLVWMIPGSQPGTDGWIYHARAKPFVGRRAALFLVPHPDIADAFVAHSLGPVLLPRYIEPGVRTRGTTRAATGPAAHRDPKRRRLFGPEPAPGTAQVPVLVVAPIPPAGTDFQTEFRVASLLLSRRRLCGITPATIRGYTRETGDFLMRVYRVLIGCQVAATAYAEGSGERRLAVQSVNLAFGRLAELHAETITTAAGAARALATAYEGASRSRGFFELVTIAEMRCSGVAPPGRKHRYAASSSDPHAYAPYVRIVDSSAVAVVRECVCVRGDGEGTWWCTVRGSDTRYPSTHYSERHASLLVLHVLLLLDVIRAAVFALTRVPDTTAYTVDIVRRTLGQMVRAYERRVRTRCEAAISSGSDPLAMLLHMPVPSFVEVDYSGDVPEGTPSGVFVGCNDIRTCASTRFDPIRGVVYHRGLALIPVSTVPAMVKRATEQNPSTVQIRAALSRYFGNDSGEFFAGDPGIAADDPSLVAAIEQAEWPCVGHGVRNFPWPAVSESSGTIRAQMFEERVDALLASDRAPAQDGLGTVSLPLAAPGESSISAVLAARRAPPCVQRLASMQLGTRKNHNKNRQLEFFARILGTNVEAHDHTRLHASASAEHADAIYVHHNGTAPSEARRRDNARWIPKDGVRERTPASCGDVRKNMHIDGKHLCLYVSSRQCVRALEDLHLPGGTQCSPVGYMTRVHNPPPPQVVIHERLRSGSRANRA